MWTKGRMQIGKDMVRFVVKHFDEGSEYGINGGRISKLWVAINGEPEVMYERGWCQKPKSAVAKKAFKALMKKYN